VALTGLGGKVAVITGGASGLGAATARRLAAEGVHVAVVDIDADGAGSVAGELDTPGVAVAADVSREEDVDRAVRAAVERFGRVDLHFVNAGVSGPFVPFTEIEASDFDAVMAVNLRGVFLGLRAALRQFERQGTGGAVVATSSEAGLHGGGTLIPYTAAKHGVIGLAKCAAVAGGPLGVRVNAIAPGIIETPLQRDLEAFAGGRDAVEAMAATTPLGRIGRAGEVAGLVAFLLSEESGYLTGAVVPIDGGSDAGNRLAPARTSAEAS
jgi:NAD(P)-dependent dehydrogenase (short-subunit alcohol dehydrogenase family)